MLGATIRKSPTDYEYRPGTLERYFINLMQNGQVMHDFKILSDKGVHHHWLEKDSKMKPKKPYCVVTRFTSKEYKAEAKSKACKTKK